MAAKIKLMSDLYDKKVFQFKVYFDSYRTSTAMSKLLYILDSRHSVKRSIIIQQGLPSGFDLMYLALADRNKQVRFGLKVVLES